MTHLAKGLVLKQRAKSIGNGLLQYLVPLLFLGRKMFHSKQAARGGADPRPRSLAYSCYLCVRCSCVWFNSMVGLCLYTSYF